jgi:hypothetical protein
MQPVFTVDYTPKRSRLRTFFRSLLAFPHMLLMSVWGSVVNLVTFFQWWIILFTGKRNESISRMQSNWLGYGARVMSYYTSMYDQWPNFGPEKGDEPTSFTYEFAPAANRLTSFFRMITIIPAAIVGFFVMIGAAFVYFFSWWAIMFTGKQPEGMFGYLLKTHRFYVGLNAYSMMLTDTYPKFGA